MTTPLRLSVRPELCYFNCWFQKVLGLTNHSEDEANAIESFVFCNDKALSILEPTAETYLFQKVDESRIPEASSLFRLLWHCLGKVDNGVVRVCVVHVVGMVRIIVDLDVLWF